MSCMMMMMMMVRIIFTKLPPNLTVQIKSKLSGSPRNDSLVLQPLGHHKVLQHQQVLLVLLGLLQPLVVDVGQVVGAVEELLVVERIVPVLSGCDQI